MAASVGPVTVGRRVIVDTHTGVARYVGPIHGTEGLWFGIEWDDPCRGKHNGVHNGTRYFKSLHPCGASFVRPEKVVACNVTFLSALKNKYGQKYDPSNNPEILALMKQTKMSSFELVGMPKVQEIQGCLDQLTNVCLSHESITDAGVPGEIENCCPNIVDLELCGNCFTDWDTVLLIAQQLKQLTCLNLSSNSIKLPQDSQQILQLKESFKCLRKIVLGNLNYNWHDIMSLCEAFNLLQVLEVPENNIKILEIPITVIQNIVSINLESNHLSWSEINKLRFLEKLEYLNVNRNGIEDIQIELSSFPSLNYLMISNNKLKDFESICELNKIPTLTSLRIQNNPLLEEMSVNNYVLQIIARLANLTVLNGTLITLKERESSEKDYLKELDVIWHGLLKNDVEKAKFLAIHPRYMELITKYGSDYSENLNPSKKIKTIKIRIVNFCKDLNTEKDVVLKTLPITMTIHRLKELGKRLFNLGNKSLELAYVTIERPDIEYSMDNLHQSLDYYSVEDGNTILIKW